MNDLTKAQKILLTIYRGRSPVGANDIVKACWEQWPGSFDLHPHALPDSNAVLANLMGDRGLVRAGWLERVGPKLYKLSEQGNTEAARIARGCGRSSLATIRLEKTQELELARLLKSKAFQRLRANMGEMLNASDALDFWDHGDADDVGALVDEARTCLVGGFVRLRGGQQVPAESLTFLERTNDWLGVRFARELERARR